MNRESKILVAIGGLLIVVVVAIMIFSGGSNSGGGTASGDLLVRSDSQRLGNGKLVEVVEFGDYQCPACSVVAEPLNQVIKSKLTEYSLVFRNFPLTNIHPNAVPAASFAEAAGKQGKFWEYHDRLYATQQEWSNLPVSDAAAFFVNIGQQLGLDTTKLQQDRSSQDIQNLIDRDTADGRSLNLRGTPTIYINAAEYKGALTTEALTSAIEAARPKGK
jgi:protein-disulfide isomerase